MIVVVRGGPAGQHRRHGDRAVVASGPARAADPRRRHGVPVGLDRGRDHDRVRGLMLRVTEQVPAAGYPYVAIAMALVVLVTSLALAAVDHDDLPAWVGAPIVMVAGFAALVLAALPLQHAASLGSLLPTHPLVWPVVVGSATALVLGIVAAAATAPRRSRTPAWLRGTVVFALVLLPVLGLWLPIHAAQVSYGWVPAEERTLAHVAPYLPAALGPPAVLALAMAALAVAWPQRLRIAVGGAPGRRGAGAGDRGDAAVRHRARRHRYAGPGLLRSPRAGRDRRRWAGAGGAGGVGHLAGRPRGAARALAAPGRQPQGHRRRRGPGEHHDPLAGRSRLAGRLPRGRRAVAGSARPGRAAHAGGGRRGRAAAAVAPWQHHRHRGPALVDRRRGRARGPDRDRRRRPVPRRRRPSRLVRAWWSSPRAATTSRTAATSSCGCGARARCCSWRSRWRRCRRWSGYRSATAAPRRLRSGPRR
jgi:hypothetical protein